VSTFSITMPSGESWTPTFVQSINEQKCIGCGRCFRVCPRGVLELVGLNDEGERIAVDPDDDDADEEYEKKVMTIARQELCIGCTACSKICPKKCYTHAAASPSEPVMGARPTFRGCPEIVARRATREDEVADVVRFAAGPRRPGQARPTNAPRGRHVAVACLGDQHLWQDLQLASRAELSALMRHWFPALVAT
jgi:Nif-specific ferredoxin III